MPERGRTVVAPADARWVAHFDRMEELLRPLEDAGWALTDGLRGERDPAGVTLWASLWRTAAGLSVEGTATRLTLLPWEDPAGAYEELHPVLRAPVEVPLTGRLAPDVRAVVEAAGGAGLLDATRWSGPLDGAYERFLVEPAAAAHGIEPAQAAARLRADPGFTAAFARSATPGVLPDPVPDAAALGVVVRCWHTVPAVAAWRPPGGVPAARVRTAVTRAVMPSVYLVGIDWTAIETGLTSRELRLPDGTPVADLLGAAWEPAAATVVERLREWRRLDDELLGPEATLRLLTLAGSTELTEHWWGRGSWWATIRRVVGAAADLPPGYAAPEPLIEALADPDGVSDEVLGWYLAHRDGTG